MIMEGREMDPELRAFLTQFRAEIEEDLRVIRRARRNAEATLAWLAQR